jgi:hypothetical protein
MAASGKKYPPFRPIRPGPVDRFGGESSGGALGGSLEGTPWGGPWGSPLWEGFPERFLGAPRGGVITGLTCDRPYLKWVWVGQADSFRLSGHAARGKPLS